MLEGRSTMKYFRITRNQVHISNSTLRLDYGYIKIDLKQYKKRKHLTCETDSVDKSNFWPHKDKRKNLTDKIQEPGSVRHDDTLKGFISSHTP